MVTKIPFDIGSSHPDHSVPEEIKSTFNLAAMQEDIAEKALKSFYGSGARIAHTLAIARSEGEGYVDMLIGDEPVIGDIGNTSAFQKFRKTAMEAFPEIRDVRFSVTVNDFGTGGAWATFWFKEPTLLRRASRHLKPRRRPQAISFFS